MPRGSGLYQKLMEKRRELEKAIADIDAVARVVRGGKAGSRGGRARKPMSEEQKHKISVAATKRHAQARAKASPKVTHRSKAINRPRPKAPRPKEQGQTETVTAY